MNRLFGWIASLIIIAGLLAGCSETSVTTAPEVGKIEEAGWPRTIADASDNGVVLKTRPERIAVLHPLYLDYFLL